MVLEEMVEIKKKRKKRKKKSEKYYEDNLVAPFVPSLSESNVSPLITSIIQEIRDNKKLIQYEVMKALGLR